MPYALGIFSPVTLAVGITALAALYALHRLRAEPKARRMATLLFWQQATRSSQPRTLFSRRVAYPLTFAMMALICGLFALSMSADRWQAGAAERVDVMVVDVGPSMAGTIDGRSRLAAAAELAREDLAAFPSSPALVTAGATPLLVTDTNVPAPIVRDALGRLTPESAAASPTLALTLAFSLQSGRPGDVLWYTDQPAVPPGLPAELAARIKLRHVRPVTQCVAISGITFEETSADASRGTLKVRVTSRSDAAISLSACSGDATPIVTPVKLNGQDTAFADLPADGRTVELKLIDAPGPPAGHTATFVLPRRPAIRVNFIGIVPDSLHLTLTAAGAIPGNGPNAIEVSQQGVPLPHGAKAAIIVATAGPAIAAGAPLSATAGFSLEGATATAGPALPNDGAAVLLRAGDVPVVTLGSRDGRRVLTISAGLLTADADMPRRAAFPVLLGQAVRDLAGWADARPVVTTLRAADDPLWPNGAASAAVLPVEPSADKHDLPNATTIEPADGRRFRWTEVLIAMGLTLLTIEGLLFAAKRIV